MDVVHLREDLARDDDLFACAATCCRHLHELGYPLISVYFERSGLLRCYGSHGYWQVLDGFPPSTGVIGSVVRDGKSRLVEVTATDEYLEAAPSVVAEACVPVFEGAMCVGAINIESTTGLCPLAIEEAEVVAACLGDRMRELGGMPVLVGWRLLIDRALQMQRLTEPDEIIDTAVSMALHLSGSRSAVLVLSDPVAGPRVERAVGPLADAMTGLSVRCLEHIGHWVEGPLSCYSVGEPNGEGFTGQDTLRTAGVESLAVFAVAAGDEQLGYLLLADDSPTLPPPAMVEQLELFSSMVAASLMNARHLARLVDQSRRDPLTGLGHSRSFNDRLRHVQRMPQHLHAVLSIDVDHFKDVNDTHGHQMGDRTLRALAQSMSAAMRGEDCLFRTGGDEFAAIVAVNDESEALSIAHRLRAAGRYVDTSVSVGVALTMPGERDHESVFARADAALYEVKRTGRGDVRLWRPTVSIS